MCYHGDDNTHGVNCRFIVYVLYIPFEKKQYILYPHMFMTSVDFLPFPPNKEEYIPRALYASGVGFVGISVVLQSPYTQSHTHCVGPEFRCPF